MKFFPLFLVSVFLFVASSSFASDVSQSSGETSQKTQAAATEKLFIPTDSSPDSFFQSMKLEGNVENYWKQILPPVSADFYKINGSPVAMSATLITWRDLATFFMSISAAGGEEAHDYAEIALYISLASEQDLNQPVQLTSSSDVFNKYAAWRERHYQLYKTLRVQQATGRVEAGLLEKQIKELGAAEEATVDVSAVAYRLATEQELTDWQAKQNEPIEAPEQGKIYGLLVINTEKMQNFESRSEYVTRVKTEYIKRNLKFAAGEVIGGVASVAFVSGMVAFGDRLPFGGLLPRIMMEAGLPSVILGIPVDIPVILMMGGALLVGGGLYYLACSALDAMVPSP